MGAIHERLKRLKRLTHQLVAPWTVSTPRGALHRLIQSKALRYLVLIGMSVIPVVLGLVTNFFMERLECRLTFKYMFASPGEYPRDVYRSVDEYVAIYLPKHQPYLYLSVVCISCLPLSVGSLMLFFPTEWRTVRVLGRAAIGVGGIYTAFFAVICLLSGTDQHFYQRCDPDELTALGIGVFSGSIVLVGIIWGVAVARRK